MSQDEAVDGARIAAEILNRMNTEDQERILKAIHAKAPEVAAKLESSLFNFHSIAELPDQAVQELLRSVPHQDVVISLKTADAEVKEKLWENMSDYKQKLVREEFSTLPPMRTTDVQAAQRRILRKVQELYPEAEKGSGDSKQKLPRLA